MGEKEVYKLIEVRYIIVPKIDEMSVSNMSKMIEDDEDIRRYFPDEFFQGRLPNRSYFFNVINTKYPGFL